MTNQLLTVIRHPKEWVPLYKIRKKYKTYQADPRSLQVLAEQLSDIDFCYATLSKVSRSFAVVIRRLPEDLRDVVCIFYLILRALDTIEDDTNVDKGVREKLLQEFYLFLSDPNWNISGIGTNEDYRILLEHFQKVTACFQQLDSKYQHVIQRICKEMGEGMTVYLDRELQKTSEYDEYCYYVAGLVGVGLSELFVLSGLEDDVLTKRKDLQIAMGQFLQKTNIIRDIHEDLDECRTFWPREIWGNYAGAMYDFKESESLESLYGLNHMVTDALKLAPQCLQYLSLIRDPGVFQFCAIPQVMAMATLAEVFNNPAVFKRNVKIRKGLAASLFVNTTDYSAALSVFHSTAETIFNKISLNDPNVERQAKILQHIITESESFTIFRNERNSPDPYIDLEDIDIQPLYKSNAH
jgi:farnesyl-diphosphate farnesyltransferase